MEDQIARYISYLRSEKRYSEHTCRAYARDLEMFAEYMRETYEISATAEIGQQHMRSYIVWLVTEKEYNPRSVRRGFSSMKTFFRFLQKTQELSANPCAEITLPKIPKRVPKFLTEKQIDELLDDTCFSDDYEGRLERSLLEMLILTGVRRAELLDMRVQDLDASALQIRVRGKGGKERLIPLSKGFVEMILEYVHRRSEDLPIVEDDHYLFLNEKGKKISETKLYQIVRKHIARCTTLDQKSPHILRHTFATMLSNGGADLNIVKDLLGHASLASTQVYTHSSIEQLKQVYKNAHPRGKKK